MNGCIFSAYCTEHLCDKSCPIYAETSYLLERNGLNTETTLFSSSKKEFETAQNVLQTFQDRIGVFSASDTVKYAQLLTYVAICQNWKGSRLHCTVYNLKYSKYIDDLRNSWSSGSSDNLEYTKIWSESAKVLIVSNLDYVNFGDFESQLLLNMMQLRAQAHLTTIVVIPTSGIVTKSSASNSFPIILKQKLSECMYRGGGIK